MGRCWWGAPAVPAPGLLPLSGAEPGAGAAFWDARVGAADAADAEAIDVVGADAPGDTGPAGPTGVAGTTDSRCSEGSGAPLGAGGTG